MADRETAAMNILVFNCGSSSLKYKLVRMPGEEELMGGEAQGVGPPTEKQPRIVHRSAQGMRVVEKSMPDHVSALAAIHSVVSGDRAEKPDAIGHRIVHGGGVFTGPVMACAAALDKLAAFSDLAPIHNPPALALVRACRTLYPGVPQGMVFDTAFHSSMPEFARSYAMPRILREKEGIRKYGFHGISHQYAAGRAARFLHRPMGRLNAVSCHLGSGGASLCAIKNGKSFDTTMGYSPLQGLMMSTRCGDLDPSIPIELTFLELGDIGSVEHILNKRCGVLGVSGISSDIRDIIRGPKGNGGDAERLETARLYLWRIRKYLGAYVTALGGAQAVIFTDSVGEEAPEVRYAVCADMGVFGIDLDPDKNLDPGPLPADISAAGSPVRILVIHAEEELAIARLLYETLPARGGKR